MKLNIGNKILLLLHWLCSLMICVAFVLCLVVPDLQASLISRAEGSLGTLGAKIVGCVALGLYVALSVATFLLIVRRRKRTERGFITVGPDEKGRVRIAVSAVEQMVRQSVRSIEGITDMKVDIDGIDDAIVIRVNAVIANGAHVPTITGNMKRAITQFVEVNCGVAVQSVEITINAVSGRGEPPRRRLLGRGKPQADGPAPVYETGFRQADALEPETASEEDAPSVTAEPDIWQGAPDATDEAPRSQAPAYDPDKPYESEFAKDLAAMKARESAEESGAEEGDFPEE